jgi:hypothetical protein
MSNAAEKPIANPAMLMNETSLLRKRLRNAAAR